MRRTPGEESLFVRPPPLFNHLISLMHLDPGMEALGMVCIPVEARMTLLRVPSWLSRYRRRRLQPVDRSIAILERVSLADFDRTVICCEAVQDEIYRPEGGRSQIMPARSCWRSGAHHLERVREPLREGTRESTDAEI
jgi:hypothetical protein